LLHGNQAAVRFAGFLNQSQIPRAYVACDMLVLPSGGETWGIVVNEAMACERACIVSDRVGCGPDLVSSGETGFICRLGDVEGLAKIMTRCAREEAGVQKMGQRARKRVEGYSISAAVNGVVRAVDAVRTKNWSVHA